MLSRGVLSSFYAIEGSDVCMECEKLLLERRNAGGNLKSPLLAVFLSRVHISMKNGIKTLFD